MSGSRRRSSVALVGIGLLLASSLLTPESAHAGNVPTTTNSTFELLPDAHRIRVTVVQTLTNRIPSTTSGNVITDYYINQSSFGVDPLGVNYRVSSTGGAASVRVQHKEGFLSTATVTFPAAYYGQSRTITTTYDILSGAPRSGSTFRAGMAYARFCGFPGGVYAGDPESLRIVVPERFEVAQVYGEHMALATEGGKDVFSRSGTTTEGTDAGNVCVEAIDEAAFATVDHESPGGIRVTTRSWPEDTEWQQAVSTAAGPTLDALEVAIGRSPDAESITLQEVLAEELSGYAGEFDDESGIARLSEDALDPLIAAHEMAHAWFNDDFTIENWLWEGYAEYYGRLVVDAEPTGCSFDDVSAGPEADLGNWGYLPALPTDEDYALVDAQYATACWIVAEVARKVGDDAMREIIAAVEDDEIPYVGDGPAEENSVALSWRKWLDLADERGLVPAGEEDLDWLQELLVEHGAATSGQDLADRSEARASYHELREESGPWAMPIVIREPMARWEFEDAMAVIATGSEVDATHDASVELVPELADGTTVEDAYEAAEVPNDMDDALRVAETEADAAAAVADAVTAADAERNPVEAVGLIGDDLAADAETAVDQLVAGDYADATSTAEATSKSGADAALTGGLRIGAVLLVTVGIGGGALMWRRRRAASGSVAGSAEDSGDATDATEGAPSSDPISPEVADEPSAEAPPTEAPPG
jgi:hypothetical protein